MTLDPEIVKRLRDAAGMAQQQLANEAGVSIALVMAVEQGRNDNPRLDTLRKLAKALGCTVGELGGDEPPKGSKRG